LGLPNRPKDHENESRTKNSMIFQQKKPRFGKPGGARPKKNRSAPYPEGKNFARILKIVNNFIHFFVGSSFMSPQSAENQNVLKKRENIRKFSHARFPIRILYPRGSLIWNFFDFCQTNIEVSGIRPRRPSRSRFQAAQPIAGAGKPAPPSGRRPHSPRCDR